MVPDVDRVTVGTVGRPHGLDGTVVVHPETDNPERFEPGRRVTAGFRSRARRRTKSGDRSRSSWFPS